jgi:hypothetical protein
MTMKARPGRRISDGTMLMVRYRAQQYELALRGHTPQAKLVELRKAYVDQLSPDIVVELVETWLRREKSGTPL